jgi:hypothetical protein
MGLVQAELLKVASWKAISSATLVILLPWVVAVRALRLGSVLGS